MGRCRLVSGLVMGVCTVDARLASCTRVCGGGGWGGVITLLPFLDFCLDFPPPAPPTAPPIATASSFSCCHTLHTHKVKEAVPVDSHA